jgi:hypothetical protein
VLPRRQQRLLAVQHVAEPEREAELEELGGLRLETADLDPVLVAVVDDAEGVNTSSWKRSSGSDPATRSSSRTSPATERR